jgi:hypothetical protein
MGRQNVVDYSTTSPFFECEVPEFIDIVNTADWLLHMNTYGILADEGYEYGLTNNDALDAKWYYLGAEHVTFSGVKSGKSEGYMFIPPKGYLSAIAKRVVQTESVMSMIDFEFEPDSTINAGIKTGVANVIAT